jgi:hypothetical protein
MLKIKFAVKFLSRHLMAERHIYGLWFKSFFAQVLRTTLKKVEAEK